MLLGSPTAIRVPCIGFGHFPLVIDSKDTAPFGTALPSQGEEKNLQMNAGMSAMFGPVTEWIQNELNDFNCAKPFPSGMPMDPVIRLQDLYAQLCVPSLEPFRSDLPSGIRFCGYPLGSNDKGPALPTWWDDFVVAPQEPALPLVVVTSGTLPTVKFTDLIGPAIEACADLPVRLLVCAVHVSPPIATLPGNVRWAKWIAFEQLFPHASILISNGGYGGVSQALASGLPLILAGMTEDKMEVNARTARAGAAINLETQSPTAEQIKAAIEEMIGSSKYKATALKLQEEYAAYDPTQRVAALIDELRVKFYGSV
jgi:hypothetical protein